MEGEGDQVDYLRTINELAGARAGEHALPNVLKCSVLAQFHEPRLAHPSTHYCAEFSLRQHSAQLPTS